MDNKRQLSDERKAVIAGIKTKKNARRKRIKKENARLRERGDKFGKKDTPAPVLFLDEKA
jgi:hypothetical protein